MSMILPIITFLPLLGVILCMAVPREELGLQRGIGIAVTLTTFFASLFGWPFARPLTSVSACRT